MRSRGDACGTTRALDPARRRPGALLAALGTWGARTLVDLASQGLSPASSTLSSKTACDTDAAHGVAVRARTAMGAATHARPAPPRGASRSSATPAHSARPEPLPTRPGSLLRPTGRERPRVRVGGPTASAAAFFACLPPPDPFEEGPP